MVSAHKPELFPIFCIETVTSGFRFKFILVFSFDSDKKLYKGNVAGKSAH